MFRIDIINNWYIDDEVRYNMGLTVLSIFVFKYTLRILYISKKTDLY